MGANIRIIQRNSDVNKSQYSGKLDNYQLGVTKKKRYMHYERDPYNEYQNFLYKRALYGMTVYTEEDQKAMHWEKKRRIQAVHEKTQSILNLWKQQIVDKLSSHIFRIFFPNCDYVNCLKESTDVDPTFKNSLTFKELKITKEDIIDKLIETGVLPNNFRSLKSDPNKLALSKT